MGAISFRKGSSNRPELKGKRKSTGNSVFRGIHVESRLYYWMEFFAQASPGTERALRDELCELGLQSVRLNRGGIPFRGSWADGWRACLHSRIAQRVQLLLGVYQAASPDELYQLVAGVDWTPYISPAHTLAVGTYCRSSIFTHSGATALKVKDAVVDQIRQKYGRRPDVDRDNPDVRIFVYIAETKVKLYLDLSGKPLHKRGYRTATGAAPLRENIAAALLRISGWDRESALADPMCGSGTIAIEAALWAGNTAPGLLRKQFGFERWANFGGSEAASLKELRQEAWSMRHKQTPTIFASDANPEVLQAAQNNARNAGIKIRFREVRIEDLQLSEKVTRVVTNPPYDERLQTTSENWRKIGAALSRMHGAKVCLLTSNPELDRYIPAAPVQKIPMKNGNLNCECRVYDMP